MQIILLIFSAAVTAQDLNNLDFDDGKRRSFGLFSDDSLQETETLKHRKWNHLKQIEDKKILIYWSDRVRFNLTF